MKTDRCRTAKLACLLVPVLLPLGTYGAIAQITPANDGTGTRVTGTQKFNITGGTKSGGNLFHNFQQFGLNAGQTANFISNPTTQNILGRITGGNASLINGLLQVSGSNANLYLVNPSGIVFGKNASLNVTGSFTATTANGIGFGNSQWFNAIGSNNYAILTSNPNSFGFVGSSGSLINVGNLAVNPGQSITLVGGTVVNTGTISAPGGNITIAAVPGEKLVRIGQDGTILSLDLPTSNRALINAPTTTPIALPELLTGGSIPSAMGVVVEDGVIKLKSGSASIAGNLTTNGIGNQTGGNIIAYADNHLNFSGMISAKGGELGGNGGFVDTSGKGSITIEPNTQVITTATKGLTGNWVIDPADLEVVAGTGGTIVDGTNDPTTASTIGAGTIVSALNGTNVNLTATNSITVNAAIDATTNVASGNLRLTAPTANLNQAIKLKGISTLSGTATIVNVGPTGTVQNGIDVVSTGGTVNLAAATYRQGSTINIAKNVTVRGLGLVSTTISGDNQYQVFNVNSGTVTLDQVSIVEGSALSGAGINNQGDLTISNSSINNNNGTAGGDAAGIRNTGSLQILRSTIRNNSASNTGGIVNSGTLTIEDSTLSGNNSVNQGAAILNSGTLLTIRRSTLSGNNANNGSGGIYNNTNGNLMIENSTITGNTSNSNTPSGIYGNASLYIGSSIVSGNSGTNGVEIYNDYSFKFNSLGYNIFGQNGSNPLSFGSARNPTDIIPTTTSDKIVTPLRDYGGPTKTHALIPSSIAINAANPTNNSMDQRGISIQGGRRDIGSYESMGFTLLSTNPFQSTRVDTAFSNPLNVNLIETAFNKPLPVAGILIGFTAPGAMSPGAVLPPIALTNAAGAAQVLAVANTKAGMYNVQANSTGITGTIFSLTNTADVVSTIAATSGSDQTAVVDTNFTNNLVATVSDKFGNPVQNQTVILSLLGSGAGAALIQNTSVTDVNGQVSIPVKATRKVGSFTTQAAIVGIAPVANFNLNNIIDNATKTATTQSTQSSTVSTVTDKSGNSGGVAAVAGGDTIGSSVTTTIGGDLTPPTNSTTSTNPTGGEPSKSSTESAAVTPAVETPKSNGAVSISVPTLMMLDKEVSRDFEGMGSVRNSIAANMDRTFKEIEQKTGAHPAIVYLKTIRRSGNSSSDTLEFTILTSQGRLARTVAIDMTMLDRDIVKFRKEVTNPIRTYSTNYLPMAKRLYNSLVTPMLPDLKAYGITNLVFIPDAGLRGLPYAALHDGKQFLIEQFSVSMMPSLSLVPTGYRDIRVGSLVSMGISQSTQGQTALPMVETELATIGQLWRNSSTYLNDRATSSLLQSSSNKQEFQILHLATHANFISGNPKETYIQFWNDRFRLDQLKELDWNKTGIDLLVLSACKTAVGDDVRSASNVQRDSELGFAGLALQSGVRTVVASLWSVNDTGTMGLISSFYERLLQSPIKAEALRQAQISMLKGNLKIQSGKLVGFQNGLSIPLPESALGRDTSFRHPYYWSAFTMVGNPW